LEKLLDKISSYNLFNYLLPGIVFLVFIEKSTSYSMLNKEVIINAFIAYFIGLIISRIGSLIIEPILKKVSFVKFSDYKDFVLATKEDNQIIILSETNNMYRTFISLFIVLIIIKLYEKIAIYFSLSQSTNTYILCTLLLSIFIFSYRKQSNYINKRVKIQKEKACQQ